MARQVPKIEPRGAADWFEAVKEIAPFYVPEWRMKEKDTSYAFWKVFAHLLVSVTLRLNRVPDKNFLAFLEMLGVDLLPPQPARAPLTFALSEGAAESVAVPARTQAAAGEVTFETEQAFTATPAKLTAVYGVDNLADAVYAAPAHFLDGTEPVSFATTLLYPAGLKDCELFLADTSGISAGDVLKVGGREWVAVAGIDGATVTLTDGLKSAHAAGTAVEKAVEFELFRGRNEQEHIFYMGHTDLFNLKKGVGKGHVLIKLRFTGLARWKKTDLILLKSLRWEYWGEERGTGTEKWLPFKVYRVKRSADNPAAAEVWLWKACGRPTREKEVRGVKGLWIRATATGKQIGIPSLVRVAVSVHNLNGPDMVFANDVPVDLNAGFYPFGKTPRLNDTFYLASQECFTKKGETVNIEFELAAGNDFLPAEDLTLSWEYWDGKGWQAVKALKGYVKKGTETGEREFQFQANGGVYFKCPQDFEPVEVNGQQNYWLRVRILSGGYGLEEVREIEKKIFRSLTEVRPPLVKTVKLKLKDPHRHYLQHACTFNELEYTPVTAESKGDGGPFNPFCALTEQHPALYLGFDGALAKGPVSIFFAVQEQVCEAEEMPRLVWEFFREQEDEEGGEWVRLDVVDGTQGMTRSGTVEFVPPSDMALLSKFGRRLYYLRAVDVEDRLHVPSCKDAGGKSRIISAAGFMPWSAGAFDLPRLKGVYLNTTWVKQVEAVLDEIIGSSTGTAGQSFTLSRVPVLEEEVWVNEAGSLAEEEKAGLSAVSAVKEVAGGGGETKELWVRWRRVEDFAASTAGSRHYVIDANSGVITFGDGVRGKIPPAGRNNLRVTYRTGGGSRGNVDKGAISTLKTALAFVDRVSNPQAAGGGADVESLARVYQRGPAVLKHRDRAVTVEDFEELAREASRDVARVKCLPNFNPRGESVPGWVTLLVVPSSKERKPQLTPQMKKQIEDYLKARISCVVLAAGRLQVSGPVYVELTLRTKVVTRDIGKVSAVENEALERVNTFLHPLTGGDRGKGWDFGEAPCLGDLYALLEGITGVDYVKDVSVLVKTGAREAEVTAARTAAIEIPRYALICSSGRHELNVEFRRGG
ncbi:MAG: putative baseplate assembly protein [Bacillota bacterium]